MIRLCLEYLHLMADPLCDEEMKSYLQEINEELSADELKSVSGGITIGRDGTVTHGLKSVSGGSMKYIDGFDKNGSGSSVKKGLEDLDGQVKGDSGLRLGDDSDGNDLII